MMLIEQGALEKHFAQFSKRLSTRTHEFTDHGQFSAIVKNRAHHASTGEVLFDKFVELLGDLDAKTIKYIIQNRYSIERK
jgi:hypothetical protein